MSSLQSFFEDGWLFLVEMRLVPIADRGTSCAGCANPTFTQTKTDFTPRNWRTVDILPFAGDARFAATATDTFSARLLNLGRLRLIQPSETEVFIRRLGMATNPSGFTVLRRSVSRRRWMLTR